MIKRHFLYVYICNLYSCETPLTCETHLLTPTQAFGGGVKERGAACIQALEEEQTRCVALVQERLQKARSLLHVCGPSTDHLHLVVSECT